MELRDKILIRLRDLEEEFPHRKSHTVDEIRANISNGLVYEVERLVTIDWLTRDKALSILRFLASEGYVTGEWELTEEGREQADSLRVLKVLENF